MNPAAATPKGPPPLLVKPPTGRPVKAQKPTGAPAEPVRFYVVTSETMRVKVAHGDFLLRKGKELASNEYDIKLIRQRGAKLVEISTPGWYIERQEAGRQKAMELKAAGHDVEVPEPFQPIVIGEPEPAPAA